RRQGPGDGGLLDAMPATSDPGDAGVQEGAVVATVQVPPCPAGGVVVDPEEGAALRAGEAAPRLVSRLHIDPFLGLIDPHFDDFPGWCQTEQHGVQLRCVPGPSPPWASPYPPCPPTRKSEDPSNLSAHPFGKPFCAVTSSRPFGAFRTTSGAPGCE